MTEQKPPIDWAKRITQWTGYLVAILALMSFVLSYEALWTLALDSKVNPWLAWLWPFTLDFFVLVASMSIVTRALRDRPTWASKVYPWTLILSFTALSTVGNAIHKGLPFEWYEAAVKPLVPVAVYVLPPVAFVLSFHLLMEMIEHWLKQKRTQPAADTVQHDNVAQEADINLAPILPKADSPSEVDTAPVVPVPPVVQPGHGDDNLTDRQRQVWAMIEEGKTLADIASVLGVSTKTVQRERDKLNGRVRR